MCKRLPIASFRASAELIDEARAEGCRTGEGFSAVVRRALRDYLGMTGATTPPTPPPDPGITAPQKDCAGTIPTAKQAGVVGFLEEKNENEGLDRAREKVSASGACLSGIPTSEAPPRDVGHVATTADTPKAQLPAASPAGCSEPRPHWRSKRQQAKRDRELVTQISSAATLEGEARGRVKDRATLNHEEQVAARVFWWLYDRQEAIPWMVPTRQLSLSLWRALCCAVEDMPEWETWEHALTAWTSHAEADGPIAAARVVSLWRFISTPKCDPGGPTFAERFADLRFQDWCDSRDVAFYGSPEARAESRAAIQAEIFESVTETGKPESATTEPVSEIFAPESSPTHREFARPERETWVERRQRLKREAIRRDPARLRQFVMFLEEMREKQPENAFLRDHLAAEQARLSELEGSE